MRFDYITSQIPQRVDHTHRQTHRPCSWPDTDNKWPEQIESNLSGQLRVRLAVVASNYSSRP